MVIGSVLAILVIVVLVIGFGMFFSRMQGRSQQRYDDNNRAGTLRTEPYRRDYRRKRDRERDRERDTLDDY